MTATLTEAYFDALRRRQSAGAEIRAAQDRVREAARDLLWRDDKWTWPDAWRKAEQAIVVLESGILPARKPSRWTVFADLVFNNAGHQQVDGWYRLSPGASIRLAAEALANLRSMTSQKSEAAE